MTKNRWLLVLVFALTFSATNSAFALTDEQVEQELQSFESDSVNYMQKIPEKEQVKAQRYFSKQDIESKAFIDAKNLKRKLRGRAAFASNDNPADLIDNRATMKTKLQDMEKLTSAKLPSTPWSDYYWAIYNGQLAYRYADNKFPGTENWKANSDYILKNLNKVDSSSVDNLSPAEKYDLIVGDVRKGLTQSALKEGEDYYRGNGKVETWMGICHGWAPAAYMLARPKKAITVVAADGRTRVKLYPSDIKALASLLWAKAEVPSRFIGGRCDTKDPKQNAKGRVTDADCFDTNPGAWHMAIVNQIGVAKRSFVMDATFDYEVWNQPVAGYTYKYFNPQTQKTVKNLAEAIIPRAQYTKDKFKEFRSPKAVKIVGVAMDVQYVVENQPSTATTDSPAKDSITTASYLYDLELDADGNIVGGEWYTNTHPDFLWTPAPNARAKTVLDDQPAIRNAKWDTKKTMPDSWRRAAERASAQGTPLASVVEALINLSNSTIEL